MFQKGCQSNKDYFAPKSNIIMTTNLPVLIVRFLGPGLVKAIVELVRAPDDNLAGVAEELPDHGKAKAQGVGLDGAVHQPQLVLGCRVCMI